MLFPLQTTSHMPGCQLDGSQITSYYSHVFPLEKTVPRCACLFLWEVGPAAALPLAATGVYAAGIFLEALFAISSPKTCQAFATHML